MKSQIQKTFSKYIHQKYYISLAIILFFIIFFNLCAFRQAFCDAYTTKIYARLADFWGNITNFIPFCLGEAFMVLIAASFLLAALLALLLVFFRTKKGYAVFTKRYYKTWFFLLSCLLLIYTLHWMIPFRSSLLGRRDYTAGQYTASDLRKLWLYTIHGLNESCMQVDRDEDGEIIFPDKKTLEQKVSSAMQSLSKEFPRLDGYYPTMKPALCSDVLDWMSIGGYTYPYTMEITYNKYTSNLYYPTLYAHESAHHQGYYQENEANFLSFLSCTGSPDPLLRYSAYHEMYSYVNKAYYNAILQAPEKDELLIEYENTPLNSHIQLDEQIESKKNKERYEKDPHPLKEYSDMATKAADTGWETQGKILAENSYDGVVQLLLDYYDYNH